MANINDQYSDTESAFARSFARQGTLCSILCECGRTFFVSCRGHGDYEEGELEGLKAKAAEDPDKFIECWAFDSIDWGFIGGEQVVVQCPCGKAQKYIDWIEGNSDQLVEYLGQRLEKRIGLLELKLQQRRHQADLIKRVYRSSQPDFFRGEGI